MAITMLFKILGIILLSSCGFFVGFEKTSKLKSQMLFWKELHKFLSQTEELIHYRALSLSQIFAELQSQSDFRYLRLNQQQSFQLFEFPDYIKPQQQRLFLEFFKNIGQTTSDALCEQMEYYLVQCRSNETMLETEYQSAVKLYPKAGLCIGLLVGLFLL